MATSISGSRTAGRGRLKARTRQTKAIEQAGIFLKNFLRHPLLLGSVVPSSRFLISRVLDKVDWDCAKTVVEYGPGVGTFTRPMMDRLKSEGRVLAIELNEEFAELLRLEVEDPRLRVAHGSCADVGKWMHSHQLGKADFILSGIPYTVLPAAVRNRILTATRKALSDEGMFVVYQYTRAVLPDLREVFGVVEEDFEPLNILPARIFVCRK